MAKSGVCNEMCIKFVTSPKCAIWGLIVIQCQNDQPRHLAIWMSRNDPFPTPMAKWAKWPI